MNQHNQELYDASVKALTDNDIDLKLAQKASAIVAKDDPELPDLGRSTQEQEIINEVVTRLNS